MPAVAKKAIAAKAAAPKKAAGKVVKAKEKTVKATKAAAKPQQKQAVADKVRYLYGIEMHYTQSSA